MPAPPKMITIQAIVDVSATALQTIVENTKNLSAKDSKGRYRVDTAAKVSDMITRFLVDQDFENWVKQIENY